jgi:hypothetical protein
LLDAARPSGPADQFDRRSYRSTPSAAQQSSVTTGEIIASLATRSNTSPHGCRGRPAKALAIAGNRTRHLVPTDAQEETLRSSISPANTCNTSIRMTRSAKSLSARFLKTLNVRSRLGAGEEDELRPGRPETGHLSSRLSAGGSVSGDVFSEAEVRPVLQPPGQRRGFLKEPKLF